MRRLVLAPALIIAAVLSTGSSRAFELSGVPGDGRVVLKVKIKEIKGKYVVEGEFRGATLDVDDLLIDISGIDVVAPLRDGDSTDLVLPTRVIADVKRSKKRVVKGDQRTPSSLEFIEGLLENAFPDGTVVQGKKTTGDIEYEDVEIVPGSLKTRCTSKLTKRGALTKTTVTYRFKADGTGIDRGTTPADDVLFPLTFSASLRVTHIGTVPPPPVGPDVTVFVTADPNPIRVGSTATFFVEFHNDSTAPLNFDVTGMLEGENAGTRSISLGPAPDSSFQSFVTSLASSPGPTADFTLSSDGTDFALATFNVVEP